MWKRIARIAASLPVLIAAGLFGAYVLCGFFLVNPLAHSLLPWIGKTRLASQLDAARVEFNPLTLEARVTGLRLAEINGAPLASFDRLYINLDLEGLLRWAWRIRDIELDGPRATFAIARNGAFNWNALIAKLNEDKSPPSDYLARVLIDHVRIANGNIDYSDANRPGKPFVAALSPLGIELDGLSTLPEDRGAYLIAARLPAQGGTLKWRGELGLNPLASSGEIGLEGVHLASLLRLDKMPRNFALPSGTLGAGLHYRFAMLRGKNGDDVPSLQISDANLLLQNLALSARDGGAPLLQLDAARLDHARFDLLARTLDVARVSLSGARIAATRKRDGVLDWQSLFAPPATTTQKPTPSAAKSTPPAAKSTSSAAKPTPSGQPFRFSVGAIQLSDWALQFTDQGFVTPLVLDAAGFGANAALSGELGGRTLLNVGPLDAQLGVLRLRSGAQAVAELQSTRLSNANLALAARTLTIDALDLHGLTTRVVLDQRKQLNWTAILKKYPAVAAVAASKPAAAPAATPFDVKLAHLNLDGIALGIVDESPAVPLRLDLTQGFVRLQNLSLDLKRALPVAAGFVLKQGGRFDASGTLTPAEAAGRFDVKLARLALQPFAPYVNQFARLRLQSGAASTHGKLVFAPAKTGTHLDYHGAFSVDNLALTEEDTGDAFLGWKSLSSDSLRLSLAPDRLHMNTLEAQDLFGKIIIFEDKTVNLKRILRSSAAPATTAAGPAKPVAATTAARAPAAKSAAASAPAFPLAIDRVRIVNADAEFADLSLLPQFGTRMHALSGVVTGVTTDPGGVAQVELDGKVDEFGSARVRGSIKPFQATDFTDLTLTFRNLEMAHLTPYSGKFAGRKIDSGKLSVDLEYKIKNRQLAGENKFLIDSLKLGANVDSPDAAHLPLDLAIALLEDSNGVIDLDLPISGSLDDPQFSYGKIVWKAIVNVLTKLVTAPFRALGKLLGISSEQLEAVGFDPGSSVLLPPEQEKLKTLAGAMAKRPALTLAIAPGYDPVADRRALQEAAMRREVASAIGVKLAPAEAPGPVDVNNYKTQTVLEDLYATRFGKAEYQKLRSAYQPKGALAAVVDSALVERLARRFKTRDPGPVSAFHSALLEQLTQKTAVDAAALQKLAQARASNLRAALLKDGLEAARVSVGSALAQSARDKLVGSKLTLGAATPAPASPANPANPAK